MIWGILFGGYFGDAIDVVAETFFHVNVPEGGLTDKGFMVRTFKRPDEASPVLYGFWSDPSFYADWGSRDIFL